MIEKSSSTQEVGDSPGRRIPDPAPDVSRRMPPPRLGNSFFRSEAFGQDLIAPHITTTEAGGVYRKLNFIEKTNALAQVIIKLEACDPALRSPEIDTGIEIMKEHLFLVMEFERLSA